MATLLSSQERCYQYLQMLPAYTLQRQYRPQFLHASTMLRPRTFTSKDSVTKAARISQILQSAMV